MPDYSKFDEIVADATYPDSSYHEFLVSLLDDMGPVRYLEVGAHKGSTLLYALESNPMIEACVIDDFQISKRSDLEENIKKFGFYDRAWIFEGKDTDHLTTIMHIFKPDFVHLDADHSTKGLLYELKAVTEARSTPSVILVHDLIDHRVHAALAVFLCENPNWGFTSNRDVFNHCAVLREKSQ